MRVVGWVGRGCLPDVGACLPACIAMSCLLHFCAFALCSKYIPKAASWRTGGRLESTLRATIANGEREGEHFMNGSGASNEKGVWIGIGVFF